VAREFGMTLPELRVAGRTGDTPPHVRAAMLKRPPHLLVTTPESLYLLVTAERSRERLRRVGTVIVDEIHAVARDKRGAHLTLTLERLEALADRAVAGGCRFRPPGAPTRRGASVPRRGSRTPSRSRPRD